MLNVDVIRAWETSDEFEFDFPRIDSDSHDLFYDTVEQMEVKESIESVLAFKSLVAKYPEFIDAWAHLGMCYAKRSLHVEALSCLMTAVAIGNEALPKDFIVGKHTLPWLMDGNRPYLRARHALGLEFQVWERHQDALEQYLYIMEVNPNDNQGVRELVAECYLGLGQYQQLVDYYDTQKDTGMMSLDVNAVLANIALGNIKKSQKTIKQMWSQYHHFWQEISRKQHPRPKQNEFSMWGLIEGSAEHAYEYWTTCGKYWKGVDGAVDLIKETIKGLPKIAKE